MEWRAIAGFPDYEIAEDGTVRRTTADCQGRYCGKTISQYMVSEYRYPSVALTAYRGAGQKGLLVHVLVAKAFIGPPPSTLHEVAHGDGDNRNNHWRNLRWATKQENSADRILHGTDCRGEKNPAATLTADDVRSIVSRLDAGIRAPILAKEYGVSRSTVHHIRRGLSWQSVTGIGK